VKFDEKLDNKSLFGLFKQLNSPEVRQSMSYALRLVQAMNKRRRMQDTGCRIQDAGCRMQDTGCRIQDTGYRMQDTGYRMQDTGYRIQDITSCILNLGS